MRRAAATAPVPVDAVLHCQGLSLAALQGLRVGQVIEIPRQAAQAIELTIPQPGGRTALVASGQLGAFQGRKVVKLQTPIDPRLLRHVGGALRPADPPAEPPAPGPRPPSPPPPIRLDTACGCWPRHPAPALPRSSGRGAGKSPIGPRLLAS